MAGNGDKDRISALEAEVAQLREELARRQPGLELSKREALLSRAERVAHMGSWAWNLRTEEIRWSDEFYRILGLDPAAVEPSSPGFFGAIHREDLERVQQVTQSSLEVGDPSPVEFRIVRPSGEVRHVRMEAALVHDEQGERAHLVGTVLDVTEQRRSAALLERTVAELNEAQRVAGFGSWRWHLAEKKVEWSPGMYPLFGLRGDELPTEELFYSHIHPDDLDFVMAKQQEAFESQVGIPLEMRIVRADASVREIFMHSSGIYDGTGELTGFFGVVQDITERKTLEAQLRQSQKMEAVGTLAGGVAHDFNNYLMVMAGHTELLALTLPEGHPGRPSVDAIAVAYERCAHLTKQLLTLSRRRRAELQSVDLQQMVGQAEPLLRSVLGGSIDLVVQVDQPAMVEADPAQVEQVLMNLVVNARDAMDQGGQVTLSVEDVLVEGGFTDTGDGEPQEHFIRLSVKDQGHGMDEDVLARIFEPFFTTKEVGKGTGLGLATAYGILCEAGGSIDAESKLGEGSTFHTYWRPSQTAAARRPVSGVSSEMYGGGSTVLLVEDVEEVRDLLRHQLESAGYRVLTAPDGQVALTVLGGVSVDVVVSDVVMPNMGGVELVRRIEREHPDVRCLLMTGYSADALQGLDASGTGSEVRKRLLRKPFTARQLVQAVGAVVARETSRAG